MASAPALAPAIPSLDTPALAAAARIASHALHGRAPAPLAERGGEHSLAARARRIYHSPLYRLPYAALMLGVLLLALAETPNPLAARRTAVARDAVRAADALALLAAAADVALQAAFLSPRIALQHGWTLTKLVVVVALAANLAANAALGSASAPYALRALRPLLLLERLRNVRKIFASVFQTAPRIVNVGVLLVLNLLLHAVLGFALFAGVDGVNCAARRRAASRDAPRCSAMLYPPQSCSNFFGSLGETAVHLFELMTAVNFPAVAIPVMRCRAWSPLFFLSFIVTAVYLLFNLALAVAYSEFSVGIRGKVLQRYARIFIGLDAAFLQLASGGAQQQQPQQRLQQQAAAGDGDGGGGSGVDAEAPPPPGGAAYDPPLAATAASGPPAAAVTAWGLHGAAQATALRMAAEAEALLHERKRAEVRLDGAAFREFYVALRNDLPRELADALGALLFAVFARRDSGGGGEPALDVHAFRRLMISCADVRAKHAAPPADVEDVFEAEEVDAFYVRPLPQAFEAAASGSAAPAAAAAFILPQAAAVVMNPLLAPQVPALTFGSLMDARRLRMAQALSAMPAVGTPPPVPSAAAEEAALVALPTQTTPRAPHPLLGNAWDIFAARWLLPVAAHPVVNLLFDTTTVLAAAAVLTQLTVDTDDAPAGTPDLVASLQGLQAFTLIYAVSFAERCSSQQVLPPSAALFVLFLRFLRLARVFRHVPGFNSTIAALFSILPVLCHLLVILLAMLYAFAIVGMELFAGRLVASNAAVAASAYGVYNYYAVINFDSLEGSLWSLFYVLGVNDWVVLMEGCVAATGLWARAYFVAFWAVIVLFLLNMVIAFVTVAFSAEKARRDESDRSSASRDAQRKAAFRIGAARGRGAAGAGAGAGAGGGAGGGGCPEGSRSMPAAGATAGDKDEELEAVGPAVAATVAGEVSQRAYFFGDWRATLAASGVDLRGWLLTRRPRLADLYDALYRDDLVATFRETFAENG